MDGVIAISLERYLLYLETLPDTRRNISLMECTRELLEQKPDTEDSLNEITYQR
jgi:hypothetical protein